MALKINGRTLQSLPLRFRGLGGFEYSETNKGSQRNIFAGEGITDKASGNPAGHLYPSAWLWPQKPGSLTAFRTIFGRSSTTGSLALGLSSNVSASSTSTFTATGFVRANLSSTITGSATVTGAAAITVNGSATLASSGAITGTLAASADGSTLLFASSSVAATAAARGFAQVDITPFTELSPQSLATAVWSAPVADNTESGSMGELLFDAGGGASPSLIAEAVWDALASSQTEPNSMGVLVKNIEIELLKRLKKTDFLALKD